MQQRFRPRLSILPTRHIGYLLLLLTLGCSADAFLFYLHPNEKRCFTEAFPSNTKVLGEYTVATGKGHMPVDISITANDGKAQLLTRKNIDHGKFAFVIPYPDARFGKVQVQEMHRKLAKAMGDHVKNKISADKLREQEGNSIHHQHRRLLAVEDDVHLHDDHVDHEHVRHEDHYDYEDDFDLDDYDGIHDEDLEREMEENIKSHRDHDPDRFDAESDDERENDVFENIKFEVCVWNAGAADRGVEKRRVRLIVHKGNAAHDYTRLAKKEHMSHLEVSLKRISDELHELLTDLDRARKMEEVLRAMNEKISRRVVILAVVSMLSMFLAGGFQALYTKKFFKRKKIL